MRWQKICRCCMTKFKYTMYMMKDRLNKFTCMSLNLYCVYLISSSSRSNSKQKRRADSIFFLLVYCLHNTRHHKPIYCLWLLKPFIVISFATIFFNSLTNEFFFLFQFHCSHYPIQSVSSSWFRHIRTIVIIFVSYLLFFFIISVASARDYTISPWFLSHQNYSNKQINRVNYWFCWLYKLLCLGLM